MSSQILALTPADMTVTVECGLTLAALQRELARHGQWLPVDPPRADTLTIHDLLAHDWSGPRRFGYGTVREHLIGMKVALADGRVIKSGGQVVKNVAGYDLAKLFIGARGSLGKIVEATFKLRPLPEVERVIEQIFTNKMALDALLSAIWRSPLTPVIFDAHRAEPAGAIHVVLGLAGTRAEVEWQLAQAHAMGFDTDATLAYEATFWNDPAPAHRLSALPSRLTSSLGRIGGRPFVARAGNGVIYHRGEAVSAPPPLPRELMRRVKAAFDPNNLLPELPS